ncbi:hypothetical protein ACTFIY_011260 [Dictyostelium cf. discoideum]
MKIVVTSFNIGIQEEDPESGENFELKNNILCLQEVGSKFGELKPSKFENITNISNYFKKGRELRIVFDKSEYICVKIVETTIRIQIVILEHIKSKNLFIVVNCHIGQKGKVNSDDELGILKSFISEIDKMEFPIIVAGDFNRSKIKIGNDILKYSNKNDLYTTYSENCIDHIMYHNSFYHEVSFNVINGLSNNIQAYSINHHALRSKFSIKKKFKNKEVIQIIQDIYKLSCPDKNYQQNAGVDENDLKNRNNNNTVQQITKNITSVGSNNYKNNITINKNKTNSKNIIKKYFSESESDSESASEESDSESENIKNTKVKRNIQNQKIGCNNKNNIITNKNKTNSKNKIKKYIQSESESESESEIESKESEESECESKSKSESEECESEIEESDKDQSSDEDNYKTKCLKEILEEIWKKDNNCTKLNMSGLYRHLDGSFSYDQLYYFINTNQTNQDCKKSITKYLKNHGINYDSIKIK